MSKVSHRGAGSMRVPLWVAVLFLVLVSTVQAAQYQYIATTKTPVDTKKNPVRAGSLIWNCQGYECRSSGPGPAPGVSDCRVLAKQVGLIASYGHKGKGLSSKELDVCNASIREDLPSPGVVQAPQGMKKTLPSPGVVQAPQGKMKKTLPSPGVVQAPQGMMKKTLPSPGVVQAPQATIKIPIKTVPSAALRPPVPIVLSQVELDGMARTLNTIGSQRYRQVVFDGESVKGGRMKLRTARAESFNGLLLLRDASAMKSIGRGLYYDQTGNLVLNGHLLGRDGKRHRSSIMLTADNQILFSKGRDDSGVIDVVIGRGKDGRMRMTGPEEGIRRLGECMEAAGLPAGSDMMTAASLCVSCLDPEMAPGSALTVEEMSCVKERADRGAGSVGGVPGIFSTNPADIDAMCKDILSSPHRGGPYRGKTADDTNNDLVSVDRLNDREPKTLEEIILIIIDACPWCPTILWPKGTQEFMYPPQPLSDPEVDPDGLPDAGAALYDFCENRAREKASPRNCYDLECARKRADSVYDMSGGRCWQEPSPAGGEHTVCRQEESERDDGSEGDPGVTPGGGPTDDPRTDLGRPRGTGGRYIDTTPMGGFLAGLCAKGGCPDFENVRGVRSTQERSDGVLRRHGVWE